jgi:kinetochore protein Spc7/SPC105
MLEDMHDSTTSTNSTRRASEMSSAYDENTSAQDENADVLVAASPADGRAQQKKRRRRSSVIPPMNFNNPDDAYSSSPGTGSSDAEDDVNASRGSDDEDTATPDVFTAAQEDAIIAGHSNEDDGGDDDVTMEMANDEITAAFRPWAKQVMDAAMESRHLLLPPEQENINPFSPAFKTGIAAALVSPARSDVTGDDMSMDITRAVGGIVKEKPASRRQSVRNRRRSSGISSSGGETMEFTTAIGGIQSQGADNEEDSHADTNEDLSMEFTAVLGGIQGRQLSVQQLPTEQEVAEEDDDGDMEMTTAIGGIIRQPTALSMIQEEATEIEMEMTTAIGGILPTSVETPNSVMPMVASAPSTNTPDIFTPRPAISGSKRKSIIASETGSPSISTRSPRTRGQAKNDSFLPTPSKSPATPSKRNPAKATRPITPGKTPPAKSAALQRDAEPKKLFQQELSAAEQTGFTPIGARTLRFDATAENTMANAYASMSPAKRRMSGLGFDKEGLGSPRVAALLDRRASIGEQAGIFTPSKAGTRMIRFEDPKFMEADIMREHQDEERRESAQYILEQEAEGDEDYDHTATLRDAIGNMTPKKTPQQKNLKGRKSLAPGGALGLLGKRPRELDDSDEDGTPRGLQGRQSSPVKRIRLQAPPTKQETIGRLPNPALSFESVRASTPLAEVVATSTTPKHQGHFKDTEMLASAQKPIPTMGQQRIPEADLAEEVEVVERIHLQDFLNMTSIRFMELNTTKRRHTVMPSGDGKADHIEEDANPIRHFEAAVVAGACTIPMLELFQHVSCAVSYDESRTDILHSPAENSRSILLRDVVSSARSRQILLKRIRHYFVSTCLRHLLIVLSWTTSSSR